MAAWTNRGLKIEARNKISLSKSTENRSFAMLEVIIAAEAQLSSRDLSDGGETLKLKRVGVEKV